MSINLERVPRRLIAIGASAGGFQGLATLFANLPRDLPATVLAVIHRSPVFASDMAAPLGRNAEIIVKEASNGDSIIPGHVYLAPADQHLIVERDRLRLHRGPKEHFTRPAVDPLFVSAARSYGPQVVGVLLSGGGEDGVSGLIAIKAHGGMSVVQNPAEAPHPSMPTSAIIYDHVDAILPLTRIADVLITLAEGGIVSETVRTAL